MKTRYRLYRRKGTFYSWDNDTGKRESLQTKNRKDATALLATKNEAHQQPALSLQKARIYLLESDPALIKRTWQHVMDEITRTKTGPTLERYQMAFQDAAFDSIRTVPLLQTRGEHLLDVLDTGTVSTNVFLRRIHNFALAMDWLPNAVLPKKQWPAVKHKDKRAVTFDEYQRIVAREHNPEWKAFYQLLWHVGGSQTDVATLQADDIDWTDQTVAFSRRKTSTPVLFHFGDEAAQLLRTLPKHGSLFPRISQMHEKHRAKQFAKRIDTLGIFGISLHSFRYSWAERAKCAGYPERFAQQALGHGSKAVARAYAKKAQMKLPSLEEYERKIVSVAFDNSKVV
jgi:integrase